MIIQITHILMTIFFVSDEELFKYIKPTGQILEGVRSMVANRLASTGIRAFYSAVM